MTVTEVRRSLEEQFDLFCTANSFDSILNHFNQLCALTVTGPAKHPWSIYRQLNARLKCYWKAAALFEKLEKRVQRPEYMHQTACSGINVLVVGCGPCGLRCAIELALLGARVIIVEKRDTFSRNNVLHLWPYLIADLRALGAKTFFGKFCAGSIDHVSIRTLQCILLKAAVLFGVQVFPGVTYRGLLEPDVGLGSEKLAAGSKRVFVEHEVNNNGIVSMRSGDRKVRSVKSSSSPPIEITSKANLSPLTTNGGKGIGRIGKTKSDTGTDAKSGWRALLEPELAVLSQYELDVLIGADGKRSCLGFPSKELRCRLALAITVNFVNYHTPAETQVEEISGVSSIFNQQFFTRLAADTGIDLENIVYYKDETHYFVMTAKKHSLLVKGVLRQDREDSNSLLSPDNVDKQALQAYARETARYVTNGKLSRLDFALNARGEPDVEVFDFTRMFAAAYSCRILEQNDNLLMQCLIGDGLFEPFWPTGSGCALGFLSALDAAWAVSRLASGLHPLQVIVQRESVYQRLSQTTAQNMPSNFADYTLDPRTRYVRCDLDVFSPAQVRHLYITDLSKGTRTNFWHKSFNGTLKTGTNRLRDQLIAARSLINRTDDTQLGILGVCSLALLRWFQFRLAFYESLELIDSVTDLSPAQWDSGANLLCLIHLYRPDLVPEVEQFLFDSNNSSEPRAVLNCYTNAPYPKPSLIRACGLLIEHFDVKFILDTGSATTTYPRSTTDWQCYLTALQESLGQLHMAGPPPLSALTKLGKSVPHPQSVINSSNLLVDKSPSKNGSNNSSDSLKRNASLQKRFDSVHSNGRVRGVFREDPSWSVEKGLLFKRRAELIATLQDPASTKRRVPPSPRLRPLRENNHRNHLNANDNNSNVNNDLHLQSSEPRNISPEIANSLPERGETDRNTSELDIKPSTIKQIVVPENVARLFAPRKGSSHCYVCDKRLYLIERLMAFGLFFHRHCFRCSTCGSQLQADKATCVRATSRNERDKFFCPAHSQPPNCVTTHTGPEKMQHNKPPRVNQNSTGVSLEARLQAGQFPFGPSDYGAPLRLGSRGPSSSPTRSQSLADLIPHNRPPAILPIGVLRNRPGQSALLAGVNGGEDPEEVMGVPTPFRLPFRIRPPGPNTDSSSTTTSPERRPPSQLFRLIRSSGDESRSTGIRDDAAPGPDCYLAGHLGLPEVERRANWELNQSSGVTGWPDASIPDILEHMRMNRVNLLAMDEYFASSESEQPSASSDHEEVAVTRSILVDDIPKRPIIRKSTFQHRPSTVARKVARIRARVPPARGTPFFNGTASIPTELNLLPSQLSISQTVPRSDINNNNNNSTTPLTVMHSADWSAGVGSLPSGNAGSATSSLLSSPAHQSSSAAQSRMAAKQKFCLEPPKPFTIDPKQFVSSRNRDRCVTVELSDCAEELGSITDTDLCEAYVNSVPQFSDPDALVELSNIIHTLDDPPDLSAGQSRLDHAHSDTPFFSKGLAMQEPHHTIDYAVPEPIPVAPVAALDEFHDLDSTSTVTERSSSLMDHRTDSDHRLTGVAENLVSGDDAPVISVAPPVQISISYFAGDYDNVNHATTAETGTRNLTNHKISVQPTPSTLPSTFSVFVFTGSHRRVLSDSGVGPIPHSNQYHERARSAHSYLAQSDTSEETSSADLDSVPVIRPLSGPFPDIPPRPITSGGGTDGTRSRLPSTLRGSHASVIQGSSFRSRCANRNRQTVELTKELESLEYTMRELERAGVQAERELYSIGPRNGTAARRYSHKSCSPISEPRFPEHRISNPAQMRARTLNYHHVSHADEPLINIALLQHSPTQFHSVSSERRYLLLKRLAALLTTKSILLEYATTVSACRDQLRLENEQDVQQTNDWILSPHKLHSEAVRLGALTRCLSDPSLSQVQLERLTELQQAASRPTEL